MKIFVPANNKGGVGKTCTSALFAEYACKYLNKKVLGLDLDPQCNFSQKYLEMEKDPAYEEGWLPPIHPDYDPLIDDDWDGRSSIANVFFGKEVIPYPTTINNFEIAPANAQMLLLAEHVRKNEVIEKVHNRIYQFLSLPEVHESYDLVVIDTAPSKGPLTRAAIRAATHMIIPTIMEPGPMSGAYGMTQLWMSESIRRHGDEYKEKLTLIGILPNLYKNGALLHKDYYESLINHPDYGKFVLPVTIGNRISFAEVDSKDSPVRSIFEFPDANKAKQEAMNACEIIAERVFA
jgi:chromosome partitioning protein